MAIVEIESLVKDFPVQRGLRATLRQPFSGPRRRVLDGVDLQVDQGEVLGILGSNGVGKTTLLKIAATFIVPTSGRVRIDGIDVVKRPQDIKAIAAYSFAEDRSFYWRLSGRENLEFCAALDNLHGQRAAQLIAKTAEQLSIDQYMDQAYATFSAGIKQRFALARALLRQPKVLFLDEPTRSVDPVEARRLWTFIRDDLVSTNGMTVILVTHQVEEAVALCDRISIMEGGKIRASLRPRDLAQAADGVHGMTLTLSGFNRRELAKLRNVCGIKDVDLSEVDGMQQIEVWSDNGNLAVAEIVAIATSEGARLHSLVQGSPVHEIVTRLVHNGVSSNGVHHS